jgi:hypothetical protein
VINGRVDDAALDGAGGLVCSLCPTRFQYPETTRVYMLPAGWGVTHLPREPDKHCKPICPAHRAGR